MNYSELLQLARFGVIFYNYQRVIIWRLRYIGAPFTPWGIMPPSGASQPLSQGIKKEAYAPESLYLCGFWWLVQILHEHLQRQRE